MDEKLPKQLDFFEEEEGGGPYDPLPKDEHERLAQMYGDENAKKAPLDKRQSALVRRKEREKISKDIAEVKRKLEDVSRKFDEEDLKRKINQARAGKNPESPG